MLENSLRPLYQIMLVDPVIHRIGDRITPNRITLFAGLLGLLFIPTILVSPLAAIGLLLISGYFDTLDGSLARFQNSTSDLGSVMDIFIDRLVEFSVILGLYLVDPATRALTTILMLGSILLCITSFLVVGIFTPNQSNKSFHYSPGLMERAEAFSFFALMIIFPHYFNGLGIVFATLVFFTALFRLLQFKQGVTG